MPKLKFIFFLQFSRKYLKHIHTSKITYSLCLGKYINCYQEDDKNVQQQTLDNEMESIDCENYRENALRVSGRTRVFISASGK